MFSIDPEIWDEANALLKVILIRVVTVVAAITVIGVIYTPQIIGFIKERYGLDQSGIQLALFSPLDAIQMYVYTGLMLGLIISMPYIVMVLYRFIQPAMHSEELDAIRGFMPSFIVLFVFGTLVGFLFIVDISLGFMVWLSGSTGLVLIWNVNNLMEFVFRIPIATGLVFQFPIMLSMLMRTGILDVSTLRRQRAIAYVILTGMGVVFTPPDIASFVLMSIPLIVLYELTIKIGGRKYDT